MSSSYVATNRHISVDIMCGNFSCWFNKEMLLPLPPLVINNFACRCFLLKFLEKEEKDFPIRALGQWDFEEIGLPLL